MTRVEQAVVSPKEQFLDAYEREHQTTMRVLRAFPANKLDLQPHPKLRTARELAWIFVLERHLGMTVYNDEFVDRVTQGGAPPPPPSSWDELVAALGKAHADFGNMVRSTPDDELNRKVRFFTGPQKVGEVTRLEFCWFLLCDQIHHRGQFSIYLRIADGKVPSIYGPSGDEPWT